MMGGVFLFASSGRKIWERKKVIEKTYFFGDKQISGENTDDAIWVIMVL